MPSDMSAIYALIGTLFGGVGLKITERMLNRAKDRDDTATQFRQELREDLASLKKELVDSETTADTWREKYFALYEKYLTIKSQLEEALRQIQSDANQAVEKSHADDLADPVLSPEDDPDLDTTGLDDHGHRTGS